VKDLWKGDGNKGLSSDFLLHACYIWSFIRQSRQH